MSGPGPLIGVLAIQGAVSEHVDACVKLGARAVEIRYPSQILEPDEPLDGIILPGGESTAMSIVGEQTGIFPALRQWVLEKKKPTWGTCAGMILLSDHCIKTSAGQSLVGGLDVNVCRNFFGSQISSTEIDIPVEGLSTMGRYPAVFIRAPAILGCGREVDVLASLNAVPHKSAKEEVTTFMASERELGNEVKEGDNGEINVKVAVRQGMILATSFHPELNDDLRWHQYFLDMLKNQ
jgi:5'-phosphate synthase pdxT subunit